MHPGLIPILTGPATSVLPALSAAAPPVAASGRLPLSPRLAWVRREKIRAGYNYNPPVAYFALAKKCGLNAIISRLEIANSDAGDVALRRRLEPGAPTPAALVSYDLIQASAGRARQLGMHWFFMINLGAARANIDDGFRNNPRRYNNGRLFAPTDDIYWTRVTENRFLPSLREVI